MLNLQFIGLHHGNCCTVLFDVPQLIVELIFFLQGDTDTDILREQSTGKSVAGDCALVQILRKELLSSLAADDLGPEEDENGDHPSWVR